MEEFTMTSQAALHATPLPPWTVTAYARCCSATIITTINQKPSLLISVMKSPQDHGTRQLLATELFLLLINIVRASSEHKEYFKDQLL